jgi:hypothetical protein
MKLTTHALILAAVVGAFCNAAQGDGKFFIVPDRVPPDVPYQRAILLFHESRETLILQSKYDAAASAVSDTLGWVVPVPAVPEVASVEPEIAATCFLQASVQTRPRALRISQIFPLVFLAATLSGFAFLLVCLAQYPLVCRVPALKTAWSRRAKSGAVVTLVALALLVITVPSLSMARGAAGIETVKAQEVGIYDVKVIRSDNGGAIAEWLTEHGFGFSDEDTRVLQQYADRGWCFVTAQVRPGTKEKKIVAEGLVAPLILEFESPQPVYPLALTATTAAKTELLIYTFSARKLTCGGRLTLRYAGETATAGPLKSIYLEMMLQERPILRALPETAMLCKFKGRLTPAQMREDLTFDPAPDDRPYRERMIVW